MKVKQFAAALSVVALSSCSSIVGKSDYNVVIDSSPSSANYLITDRNGQKVSSGTTPSTVNLKSSAGYFKGESYTVVFTKAGYEDSSYNLRSSLSGWYWGNILVGGLVGMLIVDPLTGAMYKLPERAEVNMQPGDLVRRKESIQNAGEQSTASVVNSTQSKSAKYSYSAEVAVRNSKCASTVTPESIEPFKEVYSAVCPDGQKKFVQCQNGNCQVL